MKISWRFSKLFMKTFNQSVGFNEKIKCNIKNPCIVCLMRNNKQLYIYRINRVIFKCHEEINLPVLRENISKNYLSERRVKIPCTLLALIKGLFTEFQEKKWKVFFLPFHDSFACYGQLYGVSDRSIRYCYWCIIHDITRYTLKSTVKAAVI